MDVRMPRMTGYEACKILKADPDLKDIPVVFLSAKGQETRLNRGWLRVRRTTCSSPSAPDQLTAREVILAKFGK